MLFLAAYTAGTATIAPGSRTVTGTNAQFGQAAARAGDVFWAAGLTVGIATVDGPSQLTLVQPWPGPALTNAAYEIRYVSDTSRVLAASREAISKIEEARSAILAAADIYDTIAAGMAATAVGEQFQVISGAELIRYRHETAGAHEIARFVTAETVLAAAARAEAAAASVSGDWQAVSGPLSLPFATSATSDLRVLRLDMAGNAIELMRPDGLDMHMSAQFWSRAPANPAITEAVAKMAAPFAVAPASDGVVLRRDGAGNAIEVMRPDGLDMHMSAQFWARAPASGGLPIVEARLAAPFATLAAVTGTVTRCDAAGNAIEMMRPDGLDMHMSDEFWLRGASRMSTLGGAANSALSTTMIDIISINGQSLTRGGDWTSDMPKTAMQARISPEALMLTGLKRADGPAITDTMGPASFGYDTATPATGIANAVPGPMQVGLPFAAVTAINAHRADAGVPQVPVLTIGHGIAGVPIEQMDSDPLTGVNTDTIVFSNVTYWSAQAKAAVTAAGKTVRQPWHVWTHGTSAKNMVRGAYAQRWWALEAETRAMWATAGLPAPRWVMTQSGGDANTIGDVWGVCDDQLDICTAGGAVLATPLYWYEIADNNVHPDAMATALFGETIAWAIAEVEAGRRWTIARPTASWDAAASALTVDFDSLRETEWLELDPSTKYADAEGVVRGIDAWAGFELTGASISSLALRGRTVVIGASAKPTAVRYAMQVQDATGFAGNRFSGHRGLLRTSFRKPSKLAPGKMLARAIPSFTLAVS